VGKLIKKLAMVNIERADSRAIHAMRWVARSFGIILGISGLIYSEADISGQQSLIFGLADWRCLFPVLLPILMVAIAWKWPGRWPELLSGILFTLWGLTFVIPAVLSVCHVVACESGGISNSSFVIAHQFPAALTLVLNCMPFITGVLFILAYRYSKLGRKRTDAVDYGEEA